MGNSKGGQIDGFSKEVQENLASAPERVRNKAKKERMTDNMGYKLCSFRSVLKSPPMGMVVKSTADYYYYSKMATQHSCKSQLQILHQLCLNTSNAVLTSINQLQIPSSDFISFFFNSANTC